MLLSAAAFADTAKLFTDKGSTYFRADKKKPVEVGTELDVAADASASKLLGKAVVMEVTGALARVNLDDDAARGGKFVVLASSAPAAAAAQATLVVQDDDEAPKAPVYVGTGKKLQGRLEQNGLHFGWHNDSDASWTSCRLVHSDQSWFDVGEVVKHSEDSVLRVKLGGAPPPPPYDHIKVVCAEGQSKFYFDRPSEPKGTLKGYARNDGGSIILTTRWSARGRRATCASPTAPLRAGHLEGPPGRQHQQGALRRKSETATTPRVESRCAAARAG
ncbi:MAG: hypothetical protein IPJ65_03445 [Archangiaceae bacterium]|nr:hypothetical protein [Archangiaceae bacterium]